MKTSHKVFLSFTALVAVIIAAKGPPQWPSVISRCSMDDPQFNKCLKKMTAQAIHRMAKGMPVLGLRPLDPLRNVGFSIETGAGPVSLTVRTNNVTITGPSNVQLKKVAFDKKSGTYWIEGMHNYLKMEGNYHMVGNIFVVPIDSTGHFQLEVRGGFANHSLRFGSNTKAASHGKIDFKMIKVKDQKVFVRDTTLGPEGSNAVNELVNDNWEAISEVLWNPMEIVIQDLYSAALKPFLRKFALKDFFPATLTGRSEDLATEKNYDPVSYSYDVRY